MMRRIVAIALCGAFACSLALAGCSSNSSEKQEAEEPAATEQAAEEESGQQAGMPNPWSDVATAEEAAAGAGLDKFVVPTEGTVAGMEMVTPPKFRCMEGLAEADYDFAASSMCIRKGLASAAAEAGDISGVYADYAKNWTVDVNGVTVNCYGNEDNKSMKTLWSIGDNLYSITTMGLGGDDNFGISKDSVTELVSSIQ